MDAEAVIDHYRSEDEATRLTATPQGRLEAARTRELLERLLPPAPATVLDVGGATGVYAGWLASLGHRVHVVDLVPEHVTRAAALPGVTAELGDARTLAAADSSVDAVLLMGPLYHLLERTDRLTALGEARRVTRRGGLVAGTVITRYASLLDLIWRGELDDERLELVRQTIGTGRHDHRIGFMDVHFHTCPEAAEEFAAAGLPGADVYGIEGPGWPTASAAAGTDRAPAVHDSSLRAARALESDPATHPFSAHLLVAARR